MNIAVNTRLQQNQQPQGYEDFIFDLLDRLTEKFPQHSFIYFFDKPYTGHRIFANNVQIVEAGPQTTNSLRLQYWFNFKIPKLLQQHNADVFLSLEGICSMRSKKPQYLVVSHINWLYQPQLQKKWVLTFYKKFIPLSLAKAKNIAVVSNYIKSKIEEHYRIPAEKIELLYQGVDEIFKPLDWDSAEAVRNKYTDGKAYFLYSGHINEQSNYINFLKAFTFFKKRQRSNMLLLIAGKPSEQFVNDFKNYKLKNEVKLLEDLSKEETAKITAAAYAIICPVLNISFDTPFLQAMKCQVPLIVANSLAIQSVCGEAALYCNPTNFEDIADKMMLLFKNETKAKALVEVAKIQIKKHNWDKTTDALMQSLQKAIND